MVFVTSQCQKCKHFDYEVKDKNACPAYPDGIPEEILLNEIEHNKPYNQDNDIVFEPK